MPSAIPCSLSPLISRIQFSWTGGVLFHRNSLTHRFPRFPTRDLRSLVTLAVFSIMYAATNRAYCQVLISLGLAESSIFPAVLADARPRTPVISFCTVQLRTLRRLSVSQRPLIQTLGSCSASGTPWSSAMPPSLGRGRVATTTTTTTTTTERCGSFFWRSSIFRST